LKYTVHSTVGGKLAQLGQRLIDGAAKSLAEDFFKRFDEALQAKYPSTEAAHAPAIDPASTPSETVPAWIWLALLAGAVAVWSLVR
jgi:predicted hotdog family 3-hydroxylacyl-ACP dehydratase